MIHDLKFSPSPLARGASALALAGLFALAGCVTHDDPPAPPAPSITGDVVSFPGQAVPPSLRMVTVEAVGERLLSLPVRLTWDDERTARVFAPYAGRVERLLVPLGATVRRGQALAELRSADVGQAQADLRKAAADLALARAAHERARELGEAGVMAAREVQAARADHERAAAEEARARARLAQYGIAANDVTQSMVLTAPVDGVVVERQLQPGLEVRPDAQGEPLFVISDPRSLWAVVDVPENQIASVKAGQKLVLETQAWPGRRFEATVSFVGESVDAASRMVKVRARVDNTQRELKAEMYMTAKVAQATPLPTVPADAVFVRGESSFAFVQRTEAAFERREVKVRSAGPGHWFVLAGLQPGDKVVVGGGLFLNQIMDAVK